MKKILAVARVSTIAQEIESQRLELLNFVKTKGYSEEQVVWISAKGASARSLNAEYRKFVKDIMNTIETDRDIEAVAVFSLNRLGRVESELMKIKEFLIKNKIQLYMQDTGLSLLDDNGNLSVGGSIAFSVFSATVASETNEMMQKLRRGKERNAREGKFNGSKYILYGFKLDETRHLVIEPEAAEQVKLVFQLYSTGKYSISTLKDYLADHVRRTDGTKWQGFHIRNTIVNENYYGKPQESGRVYEPIISKMLFDKANDVLHRNAQNSTKQRLHTNLGSCMWVCPTCGHFMTATTGAYRCNYHYSKIYRDTAHCDNGNSFKIDIADTILWDTSLFFYFMARMQDSATLRKELEERLQHEKNHLVLIQKDIEEIKERLTSVADLYIDRVYTKAQYEKKRDKLKEEQQALKDSILQVEETIEKTSDMLNTQPEPIETLLNTLTEADGMKPEDKRAIVRQYITKGQVTRHSSMHLTITVEQRSGMTESFEYYPQNKACKVFNADGSKYYSLSQHLTKTGFEETEDTPDSVINLNRMIARMLKKKK